MEIREIFKIHRETWGGHNFNFISEWGALPPPGPPSATGLSDSLYPVHATTFICKLNDSNLQIYH
jgi:hypothetical protein